MTTSPYHELPRDLALGQRQQQQPMFENTWRGGPRPPLAGTHRRGLTWDDLDVVLHSNTIHVIDRASRRWALDPETEQRWRRLLQLRGPSMPQPDIAPWPSSAIDSRVSFFGPREPRRTPRSRNSPLTPHTPFTPFTPSTPDSPELETPHNLVPDLYEQNRKHAQADAERSSFSALEHQITPFPLWEYHTPSPSRERDGNSRIRGLSATSLSYASSLPSRASLLPSPTETTPQRRWRVVNATAQDIESSTLDSILTSFSPSSPTPSNFSSPPMHIKSSRPQLSINTSLETSPNPRTSNGTRFRMAGVPPRSAVTENSFKVSSYTPSSGDQNNRFSIELPSPLSYSSATLGHLSRGVPRAPAFPYDMDTRYPFTLTDSSDIILQLISRLATDVLQDKFKYRALLLYRGDEAQLTLDTLQLLLDSPLLDGPNRIAILKALTRLSTKSGLYPHCFRLSEVKTLGSEAIDEGRYGDVWKAVSHDQVVCLKVLRTYQRMPTQPLLKMLSNEALLWGQLSHPNILPFYGIHFGEVRRNRFGLVSPWMDNGNVVNYLKANPLVSRTPLIHDVACGLKYLHGLGIVHGDIKGTNILVTSDGRACLADFGLSTLLGDNILIWSSDKSVPGSGGGTTRWKAPELFIQESLDADSIPTPATDIYSFACAAYEILTDRIPFYEVRGDAAVTLKLFRSRAKPSRPSVDMEGNGIEELTDELWRLLEDCWSHEPDERPSLDEVLERMEMTMKPEELRHTRFGDLDSNVARLSSSSFRKSVTPYNKPSNNDLLTVLSMISAKPPAREVL